MKDQGVKTALYAAAGVPEFWLVNLPDKIVEVYRQPSEGRYADIRRIGRDRRLEPQAFPNVTIDVSDVL